MMLLRPFTRHIWLLVFLIALQMLANTLFMLINNVWVAHRMVLYVRFAFYYSVVIAYAVTLLYGLLRQRSAAVSRIFAGLAIAVISVVDIADICCQVLLKTPCNEEFISLIAETNMQEAREFVETYSSGSACVVLAVFAVFFAALAYVLRRYAPCEARLERSRKYKAACCLVLGVCVVGSMRHVYVDRYTLSDGFELSLFGRVNELMDYEPSPDIVPTNTVVKFVEDDRPQDVVLIIGESMSKTHMSLYGYERETNPSLSAISDTALVVFDNVHSPAYITKEAFKRFMTDWDGVHGAWNEADNIVDMMKRAGYRVTWLSNQNSRGIWDNIPAKFANLSDTVCWLGNQNLGAERNNMDEELLSVFKRVDCDAPHRMTVFHLMGSHPSFERRYPKEYDRFKAAEYKEKPEKNRAEFAAYDNSVLYNDAVVSEIIDCFARRDAIVIYFSDHSLQLCETKTGVMCHAQDVDDDEVKEYAERVPFMIYMSDVYRRKHAAKAAQISALKHKKITTDSLIDYMSTIIGVRREKKK